MRYPSAMPTNIAPHQGKHVVLTVQAEIQMVARVQPDGTVTVVQAVVVPEQFIPITMQNADAHDTAAAAVAVAWAKDNSWPEPKLSADGVDLGDCAVCMVCGGCACEASVAISEVYPNGVPVCAEHVADHYAALALDVQS